ncbi:MAG: type II toxin-antitoxin system HicB family antitoxin, partial [Streptomyces sp.]
MTTYTATARRSGDWWALSVPDLPGVHSQTKRLDQAEAEVREAIALMLDIEPEEFDVEVKPVLSEETKVLLGEVEEARRTRERAAEAERQAMRQAAQALTGSLSQRDAGQLLGVSFQRVSQLLGSAPEGRRSET